MDVALEEAIRRSLEDADKAAKEEPEIVVDAKPEAATVETQSKDAAATAKCDSCDDDEEEEAFSDCKEEHDEDLALENEEVAVDYVEEGKDKDAKPSPKSPKKKEKGESFASEASSDIAMFVGETLDRMGEAIENLQDEEEEEEAIDGGAKIVEGEEDDADEASAGSSSWSVVDEEQRMARATEALGSALFNSDMQQSGEQVSALSHSSHSYNTGNGSASSTQSPFPGGTQTNLSSVTSVPSTVRTLATGTEVSTAQRDRFALQLEQLHELGFMNDALSVDVLETLTAANIGVDSDEEVTVQQVIEQLMKDW